MSSTDTSPRAFWRLIEPIHSVTYFAPAALDAAKAAGLRGFWMAYFALRAAPLGAVGPAPVSAAFFGFHPDRVARALPDAWDYVRPEEALQLRRRAAAAALDPLWSDAGDVGAADIEAAADRMWAVAQSAETGGRILGAANQTLPAPARPSERLWQACTTLRELRGDGHVAVLVAHGVTPLDAHLLKAGAGEIEPETLRVARGFDEQQWSSARSALQARGWLDGQARLTPSGTQVHQRIEDATDAAAAQPWSGLSDEQQRELRGLLTPLSRAVLDEQILPPLNPVGLGRTG